MSSFMRFFFRRPVDTTAQCDDCKAAPATTSLAHGYGHLAGSVWLCEPCLAKAVRGIAA